MRKCNDEIYQLAKDQALVKKLKNKRFRPSRLWFLLHDNWWSRDNLILRSSFRSDYRCWWRWSVYQWCEFKSRRGKNKKLTAQRSNSNTVWFNFQTYSMWTKVIPFPPSSLYISYRTIYFHIIVMKSFLRKQWENVMMKFTN
jgi:hypothetical protein